MKELFEKQQKFNNLVIENLCKRTGIDVTHKQLIDKDLLAVMAELGEFIQEQDHELKRIEYADILIFLMNCGLALKIDKCVSKHNIIILYAQAEKNIYVDAILKFNVKFSDFVNSYRNFKYWSKDRDQRKDIEKNYYNCFVALFGIAKTMDYSIDDIKQSYFEKNEINYKRQENFY